MGAFIHFPFIINYIFHIVFLSTTVFAIQYNCYAIYKKEFWCRIFVQAVHTCVFGSYMSCPRAILRLQQSLTVLPSLLVGWDHYYWLADGPAGQWRRVYLWLCVGAVVCIPCHALCPGMLPGPDLVSDEQTVAATGTTGWDSGTQASLRVWSKRGGCSLVLGSILCSFQKWNWPNLCMYGNVWMSKSTAVTLTWIPPPTHCAF